MEYQIKQLSYYAENILESLTVGAVHSVYRRTINLTDGTQILSLQTDHSPLSPISLISGLTAHDFERLSVKPGDTVRFQKDGFMISKTQGASCAYVSFTCTDSKRYDLKLSKKLDNPSRSTLVSNIQEALSATQTEGFASLFNRKANNLLLRNNVTIQAGAADAPALSLVLAAAKKYILDCNELIHYKKYQEAASKLIQLLGLGCGLTPSGDDFLCGVLAGFLFSGSTDHPFAKHLRDTAANRLSDTIDISAAFLSCALKEQFSLPVVSLYELPAPEDILTSFGAVGHSSGMDTLCGILWSLVHI